MFECGPTLPSRPSRRHGRYRGISCRLRRLSTTGEFDSEPTCGWGTELRASALQLRWSFDHLVGIAELSGFLRAPFQISKCAAGEATEFSRRRVELLGVIGAARVECGKPAAEAGELIGRQLGDSFGDFFDFHVAQYSTAEAWLRDRKGEPPFDRPPAR